MTLLITKYKQRVEDQLDEVCLPRDLADDIYEAATEAEMQQLIDYCDGTFKFLVNFSFEGQSWYDKTGWTTRLKALLPQDVIDRDMLVIRYDRQ